MTTVLICLDIDLVCCLTVNFDTACSDHNPATYCNVNWKRAGRQDYINYCALLANDAGLTNICHDQLTRDEIDSAYQIVTDRLVNYAILSFPVKQSRPYCKPYWCDDLDVLHSAMSVSRDVWCQAGRPRDHMSKEYIDYKSRKTAFRAAHRRYVESFLSDLDRDLEDAAFRDSARFWKLLRSRKGKSKSTIGAGISFEGTVYRSREDICEQWAKYFRTLYSCSDDPHFR